MNSLVKKSFLAILCGLCVMTGPNLSLAGGPISLFSSGTPYLWGGGAFATFPIPYLKDLGPLGPLTKGEADALTISSMNEWDAISNSTFSVIDGGDTPFDITSANASDYLFNFHGAVMDVVYDHDGSICAAVFGCPPGVLGLGGPIFQGTTVPEIASALVLMNGAAIDPLDTGGAAYRVVFSQESGHAIGLHHDQTNGAVSFFGDESSPTGCPSVGTPAFSNFTAMYPFASVSPLGPGAQAASIDHPEDLDALARFHPVANYSTTTGTISGTVFQSDGVTPVNGVNVIVRSTADPFGDARSTITGDLSFTPGDAFEGTFVLTGLTPGTNYTLAIDNIVDGAFPQPPAPTFTEEYWNGVSESGNSATDDPCDFTSVTAVAGSTFPADFVLNAPDTVGPTVTIDQAPGQPDPTNASPVNFAVVFSESVSDFDATDLSVSGTAGATTGVVSGSGTTYTVAISNMTGPGTVVLDIAAGIATDSLGNPNSAAINIDNTVTYSTDTTGPTVTIDQAIGQLDPTNVSPINFGVLFNEPVDNFDATDLTVSGTAGATAGVVTGSGTTYNVAISNMAGPGTVVLDIAAGVASDGLGNLSSEATILDNTVTYSTDTTGPTVTIDQAIGQLDPTNVSPIIFAVVFSETVSDFDATDLTVSGTAGANTGLVTGSGTTYTVTISTMTGPGTVIIDIAAGVASDGLGNPNSGATTLDNTVTYSTDTMGPTVTIDQAVGQLDPTNSSPY